MRLQFFIIGILIASAFIVGTTVFIGDLQTYTGITVDTSYNDTYDKVDDMLNLTSEATDTLSGSDVVTTSDAALQIASFPVLKMVMNSFDVMIALIEDVGTDLGLPSWIVPVILGIVSVLLIFAVISTLFGRRV